MGRARSRGRPRQAPTLRRDGAGFGGLVGRGGIRHLSQEDGELWELPE